MPFNLLLLPLLAGYLYLSKSNLRSYWTAQLQKEQLLFSAATYGLLFLIVSRAVVLALLETKTGLWLGQLFKQFAPFPYSGTSVGTLLLAVIAWNFSNAFVSEETAGRWLYHRGSFDSLTRLFWQGLLGVSPDAAPTGFVFIWSLAAKMLWRWGKATKRLFCDRALPRQSATQKVAESWRLLRAARELGHEIAGLPSGVPRPIMLSMKDSKVIVGLVVDIAALRPSPEYVTILPVWTGYRDSTTKRVFKTTPYHDAVAAAANPRDFSRIVRTADIASATMWEESAFIIPEPDDALASAAGKVP